MQNTSINSAGSNKANRNSKRPLDLWKLSPILVSIAMTTLSLLIWELAKNNLQERIQLKAETNIHNTINFVSRRYSLYEKVLRGGVGLFSASDFVSQNEWKKYTDSIDIENTLPGINGIGFIEKTDKHDLSSFLRKTKKDNQPDFLNHPDTNFSDKFIVKYIEPKDNNKASIGLDIGFESNGRNAATESENSGKTTLTKKITLVQDNIKQEGFLLLAPAYKEQDKKNLFGWVYAPFISNKFLNGIEGASNNNFNISIYDGYEKSADNLIYSTITAKKVTDGNDKHNANRIAHISLGGKKWTIEAQANEMFFIDIPTNQPTYIFLTSITVSIILTFMFYLLSKLYSEAARSAKKSAKKLQAALKFKELVKESNPDVMFVKDRDFRIVDANKAFLNLYPKSKQSKVIGRTSAEGFDEDEAKQFLTNDIIAFERGSSHVTETISMPNGKTITLDTKKVRFENEHGEPFILGISRDITERLRKEEELVSTGRLLEESLNEVYIFDKTNLKFIMANKSARKNIGYNMDELKKMTPHSIKPKISKANLRNKLALLLTGEKEKISFETIHERKDKTTYHIEAHVQITHYKGEQCFIATILDISERKKYEEKIKQYLSELEHSNQELNDFAQVASHDMKEPLRGIHNHAKYLLKDYKHLLDEEGQSKLARIDYLSQRMEKLVTDLLHYSKLGYRNMDISNVDFNEVIEDIQMTLIDNKDFEILVPSPLPKAYCSQTRITEALRNLITNAMKYNNSAHKTVEVTATSTTRNSKNYILLSLKDNGIGIDKKFHFSIFKMFKRLHKENEFGGGSGSGLSFTKKIIERHDGEIWVESEKGKGTTFFVSLPKDLNET